MGCICPGRCHDIATGKDAIIDIEANLDDSREADARRDIVAASDLFDADWYRARYPDVAREDAARHYVAFGAAEDRDPGPGFSTRRYRAAHRDVADSGANPLLHYIQFGRAEGRVISPAERLMLADHDLGPCASDRAAAAVAAFASIHRGLDAGARLERADGATTTLACDNMAGACVDAGGTIGASGVRFVDGWWTTDRDLRLRLEGGDATLHAIQFGDRDGEGGGAVVERPLGHASPLGFVDLRVVPLAPVLLLARNAAGVIGAAAVLPFPSLLRGGLHAAEAGAPHLQARHAASHCLTEGERVRTLSIAGDRATGGEAVFRPSVAAWLATVFAVEIVAHGADTTGAALRLPPDAVPTIAVLCARGERTTGSAAGDVIIVDTARSDRARRLSIPPRPRTLPDVQPVGAMPMAQVDRMVTASPLAIRFQVEPRSRDAMLLTPHALDAGGSTLGVPLVDVAAIGGATAVVDCRARVDAAMLVASLTAQDGAGALEVVVLGVVDPHTERLLAAHFPGRHRVAPSPSDWASAVDEAAAASDRALVLTIDATMRLHDPRTLATLATLAIRDEVAGVGCLAIHESVGTKGSRLAPVAAAYALDRVVALPRAGVAITPGPVAPFVDATLPVIANARRLTMIARDTLAALGGLRGGFIEGAADWPPEIALGIRATEAGLHNLCTGAVTASIDALPDWAAVLTPPAVDLARALALRARVATIAEA